MRTEIYGAGRMRMKCPSRSSPLKSSESWRISPWTHFPRCRWCTGTMPLGRLRRADLGQPRLRVRWLTSLLKIDYASSLGLLVAGPMRKAQIPRRGDFQSLIKRWGRYMSLHSTDESWAEICTICRVSHFLATWVETMLKVYLLDDLRSIPWYHACGCWEKRLYAVSAFRISGDGSSTFRKGFSSTSCSL
ncbi:hypothetical protein B0H14DRAFT_1429860 [Mycena olivaceomarginata]|nr:hypothetical protein B0H14DRAFT_1429860 [Mycena olivaceomarginata]